MVENVLFVCLSKVKENAGKTNYFANVGYKPKQYCGFTTNEAPVQSIIDCLGTLKAPKTLDKIVMICSEDVRKKIKVRPDSDLARIKIGKDDKEIQELSAVEYYKTVTDDYIEKNYKNLYKKSYDNHPVKYIQIDISNNPNEKEIASAIIEAVSDIQEGGTKDKKIKLHIDYNGGQRYIAFMVTTMLNMIEISKKGELQNILTMNYEHKDSEGRIEITDMKNMFDTQKIALATNEIINYGRVKSLYEDRERYSPEEQRLIEEIKMFTDDLQICNTTGILINGKKLHKKLKNYIDSPVEAREDAKTLTLKQYSMQDVLQCYEPLLLSEDYLDMIKWCKSHDFIQQALTFCVDLFPYYLYDKKIFGPSERELEEYKNLYEFLSSKVNSNIDDEKNTATTIKNDLYPYMKGKFEFNSVFAFNWYTNYISFFSYTPNKRKIDKWKKFFAENGFKCDLLFETPNIKPKKTNHDKVYKEDYLSALCKDSSAASQRIKINIYYRYKLDEFFKCYYIIKNERNSTNHSLNRKSNNPMKYVLENLNNLIHTIDKMK